MSRNVLISGAGVAGSTLAYWLARQGFTVTVVERADGQRSSGNPVDVRGPALAVVERMGITDRLRDAATAVHRLVFLDAAGREQASMNINAPQGSSGKRDIEIARADLAAILLDAARDNAEIRWGDSITGLTQRADGVEVTFEHGAPGRFDLVVGADGLHSTVRRLAFGPEREFVHYKGMLVATLAVDRTLAGADAVAMYNAPGLSFSVHPARGIPLGGFFFRHAAVPGIDRRDLAAHKRLIIDTYTGRLGVFEEFLDQLAAAEDIYFDAVSQVRLPSWTTGRITLIGDAASSLSLFGDGSTLAISAAHTLAEELAATTDLAAALHRYERRHRTLVKPKQRGFTFASQLLIPASHTAITLRNTAVRTFAH
ncbi:FAD-dependent oxidoreductase [Nocardia macrotermitis]|uniref:FAD-binding domain-containing protein n=1 Tax=Nocardia macrotermitis TaxID=2585198 RepID=A0A7K0CY19_9NOCA|nr:FAD-dependent oxidoreductase [Nocardia macrotermitis]MQY17842.1 hypothetical protein [Nocardia macrotermitis]